MPRTFLITGFIMAALFVGCGFLFIGTNFMIEKLPSPNRMWFGVIFIVYGGFRFARQYNQYKKTQQEENE